MLYSAGSTFGLLTLDSICRGWQGICSHRYAGCSLVAQASASTHLRRRDAHRIAKGTSSNTELAHDLAESRMKRPQRIREVIASFPIPTLTRLAFLCSWSGPCPAHTTPALSAASLQKSILPASRRLPRICADHPLYHSDCRSCCQ